MEGEPMSDTVTPIKKVEAIRPASGSYGASPDRELRLDVDDGLEPYPQMMASGRFIDETHGELYWVAANLQPIGSSQNEWTGKIRYVNPHVPGFFGTDVHISLTRNQPLPTGVSGHTAHVAFGADHVKSVTHLPYQSPSFRKIHLVFAVEEGEALEYEILRGDEKLSIPKVFTEAGFEVTATIVGKPVGHPAAVDAGSKASILNKWTHEKLDVVMRSYWEQNPCAAQEGVWVFCGSSYWRGWRGVMFDSKGYKCRQGCATFRNSDAFQPGEQFRLACHEIGHCLNLPHSNIEMRDVPGLEPWFDTAPEVKALTFMRHPDREMMTDDELMQFKHCFSRRELTFLRHAPEAIVYPSSIRFLYYDEDGPQVSVKADNIEVTIAEGEGEMGCSGVKQVVGHD
jgi:hypothetical protein